MDVAEKFGLILFRANFGPQQAGKNEYQAPFKTALFPDITDRGSYEFTGMRFVMYADGDGFFQVYAKGKQSITFSSSANNNTGPHFFVRFLNAQGIFIDSDFTFLGEANYHCYGRIQYQFSTGWLEYNRITQVEIGYRIVVDRRCS